jgi:hypothetical protein
VLDRLDEALASLPPAERAAVVAAHGYAEGPVGARWSSTRAADADALARNGLQLLRRALADLEPWPRARRRSCSACGPSATAAR